MNKILAVIPARAGSKGIPNKNIRLVNGRPLIWYVINNAKKSKLITDIIVTTDSEDIAIIASQMKVNYKHRNPKLCEDNVTLDAVVYDVCKNKEYDYVVTMQPTSPTLKVETLDKGIEYCIDKNLDTLISVVNKPFLSWREENGVKVPNYKERLNRQYLPKNYLETGAFLISKNEVVSINSRIGNNADVYEITEEEAVDIDSYSDLLLVESIMLTPKVAIYVNGNNTIGVGHIYRALELADEFYCKPTIIYDINQTEVSCFGNTTHELIGIDGKEELLELVKEKEYSLFINDILDTTIEYMNMLREALPDARIVNFEDLGEGAMKADLVINALYKKAIYNNMYVGSEYYIAPKSFMFYEPINIREIVNAVLVTFGGSDPKNYTDRLLNIIIKEKYKDINFKIVLGKMKKNVNELLEYNKYENMEVIYNVKNMPELMSKCDIAITSRGRTTYELAMLGIPTIAMAQNQREEYHNFACEENGFTYLGIDPSDHIIEMELDIYLSTIDTERIKYQKLMLRENLRNGRERVSDMLESLLRFKNK